MQNRDQSRSLPAASLDGTRLPMSAGFRVVARRRNGVKCLVSLATYREEAVELAENFRDVATTHCEPPTRGKAQKRDALAAVIVEEWVGTPTVGRWKYLDPQKGGFCHVFPTSPGNGRFRLKSGERVDCVLLPEKTRKKGWKAKVVGRDLVGPITNTKDIPKSVSVGQKVSLRVGAISTGGKHIQFDWLPDSDRASQDAVSQRDHGGNGAPRTN